MARAERDPEAAAKDARTREQDQQVASLQQQLEQLRSQLAERDQAAQGLEQQLREQQLQLQEAAAAVAAAEAAAVVAQAAAPEHTVRTTAHAEAGADAALGAVRAVHVALDEMERRLAASQGAGELLRQQLDHALSRLHEVGSTWYNEESTKPESKPSCCLVLHKVTCLLGGRCVARLVGLVHGCTQSVGTDGCLQQ